MGGWAGMTLSQLAQRTSELNEAWARADAAWARREAEIRRPARKINVISDEEFNRLAAARTLYRAYLTVFIQGFGYRDLGIRQQIDEFARNHLPSETGDQRESAAAVAQFLSDSLILYCQAACDPSVHSNPIDIVGYYKIESASDFEKVNALVEISAKYLGLTPEYNLLAVCEAAKARKPPSEYILGRIIEAMEDESGRSASERDLLKKFRDDKALQEAFYALVTGLCVKGNAVPIEAGCALVQIISALPENAGIEIPRKVEDNLLSLRHGLSRWKKALKLKDSDEIKEMAERCSTATGF
ncbi:hypothetical protein BDV12DRAFT_168093 [Aspergillus spectabilis]